MATVRKDFPKTSAEKKIYPVPAGTKRYDPRIFSPRGARLVPVRKGPLSAIVPPRCSSREVELPGRRRNAYLLSAMPTSPSTPYLHLFRQAALSGPTRYPFGRTASTLKCQRTRTTIQAIRKAPPSAIVPPWAGTTVDAPEHSGPASISIINYPPSTVTTRPPSPIQPLLSIRKSHQISV
jgi:hypothetical protein